LQILREEIQSNNAVEQILLFARMLFVAQENRIKGEIPEDKEKHHMRCMWEKARVSKNEVLLGRMRKRVP